MLYKLVITFLVLSISLIAPYFAYLEHKPYSKDEPIYIKDGLSINDAISEVAKHNFVNKVFLKYFLYFNKIKTFKSGEYDIYGKPMSEIIFDMNEGNTITHKILINEGTNIYDLNNLINDSMLVNDCQFLSCIRTDFNFKEGILYPDTYFYKKGNLASNILQKSHDRLKKYLDELKYSQKNNNNLDINEILILSSIVEKEAGNNNEKKLIAGVFLNRLEKNMRLQADPTIIYGLLPNFNGDITKANLRDKNNPYNTYQIPGLPPTPISTISKSSLEAVILGMKNDYLYFVAKGDGTHKFSKTYKEHLDAVNRYQLN